MAFLVLHQKEIQIYLIEWLKDIQNILDNIFNSPFVWASMEVWWLLALPTKNFMIVNLE